MDSIRDLMVSSIAVCWEIEKGVLSMIHAMNQLTFILFFGRVGWLYVVLTLTVVSASQLNHLLYHVGVLG
jgi:hypothetical protein